MSISELHKRVVRDPKRISNYYNKFKYKIVLDLPGIQYFRSVKTIDQYQKRLTNEVIEAINEYDSAHRPLKTSTKVRYITIIEKIAKQSASAEKLRKYFEWYEHQKFKKSDFKIRLSRDQVDVFFNDFSVVELLQLSSENKIYLSDNILNYDKNKIYLKNSNYQYRIYLKHVRMSGEDIKKFSDFLCVHAISPCGGLRERINRATFYVDSNQWNPLYSSSRVKDFIIIIENNFVDLNEQELTVFSLIYPEMIKKVYKIERRVDIFETT